MHSKFGLFQMSSLSLCAALSKVNFVVYYKFQFWKIVNQWPDATYACLNYGEAYAPDEIIDRSICINGDIREILMKL